MPGDKVNGTRLRLTEPAAADSAIDAESLLFRDWTPAELLAADTGFTWLVEGMYATPTYGMTAGESKTAKSTIGAITQMCVAAGEPVLGQFKVPKARPVVVYVGEGGRIPHTRLMTRISEAMGVPWRDLPIYPRHEIAAIMSPRFQATLARDLEKYEPGLVVIDPYYAFHGSSADSRNLHEEAEVLNAVSAVCVEAGAVLDITHHFNRGEGKGLRRITMAGGAEWVDTWRLLEHREQPDVDNGRFQLRLEIGSRQWGGSAWDIDLNLGRFQPELGLYDGPITWQIRRPGTNPNNADAAILDAVAAEPLTYTKEELARRAGGRLTDARHRIEALTTRKLILPELTDRPNSAGQNRKVWTYRPGDVPAPDDTNTEER